MTPEASSAPLRCAVYTRTSRDDADAGFSGGTLDRPALQRMLADIEADRVDLVVVHKIDRLSRSLVHFVQSKNSAFRTKARRSQEVVSRRGSGRPFSGPRAKS